MEELINFYFHDSDKEFIVITRYSATWTNSRGKYSLSFYKTEISY